MALTSQHLKHAVKILTDYKKLH